MRNAREIASRIPGRAFWSLFGLLACLALCLPGSGVRAQGLVNWEAPVNLSDTSTSSELPAIVADPYGMVHVFWGENLEESTAYPNAIMYTHGDGHAWSPPRDVLLAPEGIQSAAQKPSAAFGATGDLFVVFAGGWGGSLYFSAAPVLEATHASTWRKPILLNELVPGGDEPRIAVGPEGVLHVLFCVPTGSEQGIYHTRSQDGGWNWTPPRLIPGSRLDLNKTVFQLRMAVDSDGVLHATWSWADYPDTYPPKGILYARSTDLGETWSSPASIADGPLCCADVALAGHQEVHLFWSGTADQRFKFDRISRDGGLTWSEPFRFPQLGGYHGPATAAVDSQGFLHVIMGTAYQGIEPDVMVHSRWDGRGWSEPEILLRDMYPNPQTDTSLTSPQLVVSEGNLLHIVVAYPVVQIPKISQQFDIFYLRGRAQAPHVEPLPLSAALPESVPTPASTDALMATSVPGTPDPGTEALTTVPGFQPARTGLGIVGAVGVGGASAFLVLLAVVLVQRWRR